MKITSLSRVFGRIVWLEIRGKNGKVKKRLENIGNYLLNSAMGAGQNSGGTLLNPNGGTWRTLRNTQPFYEDLPGTWDQNGMTVTRASGAGTFPTSAVNSELYWHGAGEHSGVRRIVSTRISDTSVTTFGDPVNITGGRLRLYYGNGSTTGWAQSTTGGALRRTLDHSTGIIKRSTTVSFSEYTGTGYTFLSVMRDNYCIVDMPEPITIEFDDRLMFEYEVTEIPLGVNQDYELGEEAIGIPQKYPLESIVGNGSHVDVTFSEPTHFMAGDRLDLRKVIPKRVGIVSADSTSTTFTIHTTGPHGLLAGDLIVIEDTPLAGYSGGFTVASVISPESFTVTDSANPGPMDGGGTVRKATPDGYFNSLELATVSEMISPTVARIESDIIGPPVNLDAVGGDPGVSVRFRYYPETTNGTGIGWGGFTTTSHYIYPENIAGDVLSDSGLLNEIPRNRNGSIGGVGSVSLTSVNHDDAHAHICVITYNAGGTSMGRLKQIVKSQSGSDKIGFQITFATPINKLQEHRFRIWLKKDIQRDLPDLDTLPE